MVRYIFVVIPSCVCIAVCGWSCSFVKSFDCFAYVAFFFSFFLRDRVLVQQKTMVITKSETMLGDLGTGWTLS